MTLSLITKESISQLLKDTVRNKLESYNPETSYMPFHYRLLGQDRYAMFSFIQSMNTTFGLSVWEQIAVVLAQSANKQALRQHKLLGEIDKKTEDFIHALHHKLREGSKSPNIIDCAKDISELIRRGQPKKDPDSTVDLFIKDNNEENYFDITSAKPNMKEFAASKLKLLRWTALRYSQGNDTQVYTRLAIPYNPYHPNPYERWTLKGLYDLENGEVLVGEEFWNFVANDNIYEELLEIFQSVGEELRAEIDGKFAEFRRLK